MKVAIVAPCHIQPSKEWTDALLAEEAASGAHVIIVDDSDGAVEYPPTWDVYGYKKQELMLGPERYGLFRQFQHSSACKQFGLWVAYQLDYEVVIVIDSDCVVPKFFVESHLAALTFNGDGWENPLAGSGWYSRGFPYTQRDWAKWAHMGLWEGELDLYGQDRVRNLQHETQLKTDALPREVKGSVNQTPAFFPLSGMNVSFVREAIPYMLFLPNFCDARNVRNFTRHDDIWGGYIFQKAARECMRSLSYGGPVVFHQTVVEAAEDAKAEEAMIEYEDQFFGFVDLCFAEFEPQTYGTLFRALEDFSRDTAFRNLASAFRLQYLLYA